MKFNPTKRLAVGLLAAALPLSMAGCAKGGRQAGGGSGGSGGELTMWTHNAGNTDELAAINKIVDDYNASQTKYKVKVQAFPQDSYNDVRGRRRRRRRSCPASWTSTAPTCPTGPGPAT